ncbi:hypothetical protein KH5H1_39110 [Corallococcus caeni]|nr:hypothetical protein KH5H1_39110 [Corallococcus sp. KH5-1]
MDGALFLVMGVIVFVMVLAQRAVSKDLYERLRTGSGIQVLHDRDAPGHSYPEGEGGIPLVLAALASMMAGGVSITGLVMMLRKGTTEEDFLE